MSVWRSASESSGTCSRAPMVPDSGSERAQAGHAGRHGHVAGRGQQLAAPGKLNVTAWAQMTGRAGATASYSSGTLQPPTGLHASACGAQGATNLAWTASPSGYATGYQVWAQPAGGTPALVVTVQC